MAEINSRRNFLKTSSAAFLAASLPSMPTGTSGESQQVFYAHGMVWNTDLPGAFGDLRLTFDFAVRLGGIGLGTFADAVHPELNSHFRISSTARNGNLYRLEGEVTSAVDPSLVGAPITITAEVEGSTTGVTITIGALTFKGAGLVVLAIIAVLISLLLPAT
jgi:hypothetical protein